MECHDDGRIVNKLEDVDMVDLQASKKQKGLLGTIEFLGNKLPHPVYIFVILTLLVIALSSLTSGIKFIHPGTGKEEVLKSLVTADGFRWILKNLVNNFTKFPPLGMVFVMVVTTQVGAQSRDLSNLRREATQLSYEVAARRTELQGVSSSGSLALRASELGMVPNPFPAFVDLSNGTIVGRPQQVKGDEAPYLTGLPGARQTPAPASPEPEASQAPPASTEEATPRTGEGER